MDFAAGAGSQEELPAACPLGRCRVQPSRYASFTHCEPARNKLFVRGSKSFERFEEASYIVPIISTKQRRTTHGVL